jgi:hypothetical protein
MNYTKKSLLILSAVLLVNNMSAQTADKVIDNYIKAIGGKDLVGKTNSLYYESTVEVMGITGKMKTTILNGKGYKQEMELMGSTIVTCFSETEGWSVNPMAGETTPKVMTEKEFNDGKNGIFIGAPFINYQKEGFKAEMNGEETINDAKAFRLELTSPSNKTSTYYFDANTYLILKVVQVGEQGESISNYSDYRDVDGFKLPYKVNTDINGGQIVMKMTVQKASLNIAVDEAVFRK